MFCRNCGNQIGDAKFCPSCGFSVNEMPTQPPVQPQAPPKEGALPVQPAQPVIPQQSVIPTQAPFQMPQQPQTNVIPPQQPPQVQYPPQNAIPPQQPYGTQFVGGQGIPPQIPSNKNKGCIIAVIAGAGVFILAIVLLFVFLWGRGNTKSSNFNNQDDYSYGEGIPMPQEASDIDDVIAYIEEEMHASIGESNTDVSYDEETDIITISFWMDGMTAEAMQAASGNSQDVDEWNAVISEIQNLNIRVSNKVAEMGFGETTVEVFLLNDTDNEYVLIYTYEGELLYNIVED